MSFGIHHYAGKVRSCDFYLVQITVAWSLFVLPKVSALWFLFYVKRQNGKVCRNLESMRKFSCVYDSNHLLFWKKPGTRNAITTVISKEQISRARTDYMIVNIMWMPQ